MVTGIPRGTTADYGGPGGSGGTGMRSRPGPAGGWTAGRVVTLIIGSVLALMSPGFLGGGGTLLWAGQALRHDGFVTTSTSAYSASGYALASDRVSLHWGLLLTGLVGDVRVRADAGVSAPGLLRLALKLVAGGITLGALSAALIWVPVRLAAGAG